MKFCIAEFLKDNSIDLKDNEKAKDRVRLACRAMKVKLSTQDSIVVTLETIANFLDLEVTITK